MWTVATAARHRRHLGRAPPLRPEHRARYEAPEGEPGVVRMDTYPEPPIERVLEALQDSPDP